MYISPPPPLPPKKKHTRPPEKAKVVETATSVPPKKKRTRPAKKVKAVDSATSAPPKKKYTRPSKKSKAADSATSPLPVTSNVPTQNLPVSKPALVIDVKELALAAFDFYIAPEIHGVSPTLTSIRRAIVRRILSEYISKELTRDPPLIDADSVYHFIIEALGNLGIYH